VTSPPERNEEDPRLITAVYARYSSDNQSETSVEDQVRLARDRAEQEGLRVPAERIYSDRAVSGTLLRREGLDRLIQDAKRGRFQV
jgi:DNA invertase Pin-like site-specific DNA recombinase